MSKFDWKKTLATVAPTLAAAMGGPMAGMAAQIACKALGIDGGDESALENAVAAADPAAFLQLKTAEQHFKIELKKLDIDLQRLEAEDRNSARDMAKNNGQQAQVALGCIYTGGFVWLLYSLFTGEVAIDPQHEAITNVLLGMLSAGQAQVLNFFFGSSSGSKAKTNALAIKTP